jgi:phage-related baseplate assembly protein
MSFNLPDIKFLDYDPSNVEQAVISTYEAIADTTLYPGDPVRLFLEGLAYIIAQQRYNIDWAAKQNLLAFSSGEYLDHLGVLTDTTRLSAQPAKTTMRFSLAGPLSWAVTIPKGTRCTANGKVVFKTEEAAEIPSGSTQVEVQAKCQTPGAAGNGFLAGQINKLVDPVSHVSAVSNTTMSLGGADEESDENLRQRIQLAPEKYSSAGPDLGYKYFARQAHQDILDVSVVSPQPGEVVIYVLMQNGELPSQEILDAVEAEVSAKKRRPLNDDTSAQAPEQISYNLELTYYISTANSTRAAAIQQAVQKAVDAYLLWQKSALGRDINPSELTSRIQQAGAKRVEITSPASFQALDLTQVAAENTVSITYGGLEDA